MMRRQRLLKAQTPQRLCIFCAYRLTGNLPTSNARGLLPAQRRHLNTSKAPSQSHVTAAAPAESSGGAASPKWSGFNPSSLLSAAEQRERALLRQRIEEQERQRRQPAEKVRRKKADAAAAEANAVLQLSHRKGSSMGRSQAAPTRTAPQNDYNESSRIIKQMAAQSSKPERSIRNQADRRAQATGSTRAVDLTNDATVPGKRTRDQGSFARPQWSVKDQPPAASTTTRPPQQWRLDPPGQSGDGDGDRSLRSAPTVSQPDFMKVAKDADGQSERQIPGWGSKSTVIKPPDYAQDLQRPDNVQTGILEVKGGSQARFQNDSQPTQSAAVPRDEGSGLDALPHRSEASDSTSILSRRRRATGPPGVYSNEFGSSQQRPEMASNDDRADYGNNGALGGFAAPPRPLRQSTEFEAGFDGPPTSRGSPDGQNNGQHVRQTRPPTSQDDFELPRFTPDQRSPYRQNPSRNESFQDTYWQQQEPDNRHLGYSYPANKRQHYSNNNYGRTTSQQPFETGGRAPHYDGGPSGAKSAYRGHRETHRGDGVGEEPYDPRNAARPGADRFTNRNDVYENDPYLDRGRNSMPRGADRGDRDFPPEARRPGHRQSSYPAYGDDNYNQHTSPPAASGPSQYALDDVDLADDVNRQSAFRQDRSGPRNTQRPRWQRDPAIDDIGSSQSPRDYEYNHGSNGQYRVSPFQPQDFRQDEPPFDDEVAANWQHLRRRSSEPPPPPPPPPPLQKRDLPSQRRLSDMDVDRIFEQHWQQRQPPRQPYESAYNDAYQSPTTQDPRANIAPQTQNSRCARCRKFGHAARDCTGPARSRGRREFDRPPQENRQTFKRVDLGLGPADTDETASRFSAGLHDVGGNRQIEQRSYRGRERENTEPSEERKRFGSSRGTPEEPEEPAERTLRSRKFADDGPRRSKPSRRGRPDEDDDDKNSDRTGARRGQRGFDDDPFDRISQRARIERESVKAKEQREAREAARRRAARKADQTTQLSLPEFVSVATLAQTLGVRYEPFVEKLADLGYDDIFPGKILNSETSGMIAMEYNFEPVFDNTAKESDERDLKARPEPEDKTFLPTRPPVVTIMGHVDHGKTTILDYLRKSSVAAGEAGGITQHIGAFSVPLAASGKTITFLDTPGHAAFLAMRQRGANVTDIVILVVAADDSVKPQTLEAIRHANTAGVPMIVAINKVDKQEADVQRVKQDLARYNVEIEDFGGDTQVVCVSGKTGEGMQELEEAAVTLSEILDHRAESDGAVEGWVLEATTKKAGRVATVLVRRGTLKPGNIIVAGNTWARVRSLRNEAGQAIMEATPGVPVEVDGWRDQPLAGDEMLQAESEQKATSVVGYRLEKEERQKTAQDTEAINESRRLEQEKREKEKAAEEAAKRASRTIGLEGTAVAAARKPAEEVHTGPMSVPFIIKADVSGSAEAVSAYIQSISSPLIYPRILQSSVGPVHESDIDFAAVAEGHIVSFNLPKDEAMKGAAEVRGVKVLENNIIYRVLDDVKAVLEAKLPPVLTQKVLGDAEISVGFEIGVGGRKKRRIAGCKVRDGSVGRGSRVRVLRGQERMYDGTIDSLKNVKKDVNEMRKGTECGIGFDGWDAFEVGDRVQTYEEKSEKRKL